MTSWKWLSRVAFARRVELSTNPIRDVVPPRSPTIRGFSWTLRSRRVSVILNPSRALRERAALSPWTGRALLFTDEFERLPTEGLDRAGGGWAVRALGSREL